MQCAGWVSVAPNPPKSSLTVRLNKKARASILSPTRAQPIFGGLDMLSVTRSTEKSQFNYTFDADAFARQRGYRDYNHLCGTAQLLEAVLALRRVALEIKTEIVDEGGAS